MTLPNYTDEDLRRIAGIKDEQFSDHMKAMLENIDTMLDQRLGPIEQDLAELKSDMKIVKAAVTHTSHQVHDHEKRLTRFEARAA